MSFSSKVSQTLTVAGGQGESLSLRGSRFLLWLQQMGKSHTGQLVNIFKNCISVVICRNWRAESPGKQDGQVIYSLQSVLGYLHVPWSCYCILAAAKGEGVS
jgi:hypothetical protein